jgi:hypothetical protein
VSGLSKHLCVSALLCSLALFTACSNGDGAKLRVMNASPDAGELNFTMNDRSVGSSIDYTSVSDY